MKLTPSRLLFESISQLAQSHGVLVLDIDEPFDAALILVDADPVEGERKFEGFDLVQSFEKLSILDLEGVCSACVGLSEFTIWAQNSSHYPLQ